MLTQPAELSLTGYPPVALTSPHLATALQPDHAGAQRSERATFNEKRTAFLLGLGTRLQVQLIGYLPFTEIFLLLAFPFYLPRIQSSGAMRRTGWLLPLLALWFCSTVASDLFRQTAWSLSARGLARSVIFMIAIPFFTWFLQRGAFDKILWWTIGTLPSVVLSGFIFRGGVHEARERIWGNADIKYETHWGGAFGVAVVIFCLLTYHRSRILCYLASIAVGCSHIANGMRSTGAYTMLASVITASLNLMRGRLGRRNSIRRIATWKLALIAIAVLGACYLIATVYANYARSGMLGERARVKYLSQASNKYGLLIGGRPEVVAGMLAIADSPILGYGSWPLDNDRFFARACDLMEVKLEPLYYKMGYPLIPTHSHIISNWVESGIFAVAIWFYVLWIIVRAIYLPIHDEKRLRFWIVSSILSFVWAIFFSPVSSRLEHSFLIGAILNQVLAYDRRPAQVRPQA